MANNRPIIKLQFHKKGSIVIAHRPKYTCTPTEVHTHADPKYTRTPTEVHTHTDRSTHAHRPKRADNKLI